MFNNQKPNIILLADFTDPITLSKTLGPYKVASELRQAGYEVAVIHHLHVFTFSELKHILKNLISDKTLFVGINSMFYLTMVDRNHDKSSSVSEVVNSEVVYAANGALDYNAKEYGMFLPYGKSKNQEFKEFIKTCNPNCKLVLGGPDANDLDYIKDYDYVITGYADMSIVNLADYLQGKCNTLNKAYRSLYGPTIINDSLAEKFDFANSTMRYESHDGILPGETLLIEIARGCIFSCAFCNYPLNGKKKLDYIKHEELLYQEFLDNYERFGITRYRFSDDTFNDSREKIEMIYRISKRLPFKLEYWAYIRLDLLTSHIDLLDKLYQSGLRAAFFGIESLHKKTSQVIGKSSNRERQIATLRLIKERYGDDISITGSFIFGLPEEPYESMKATSDFLLSDKNPLDFMIVNPYYIYPKRISGFSSKVEVDNEKYGYKVTKTDGPLLYWENEHTNFAEVTKLATHTITSFQKKDSKKVSGFPAFDIAGLGFDLKFTLNQNNVDFDWGVVHQAKERRAQQYKDILYKECNIPPFDQKPNL